MKYRGILVDLRVPEAVSNSASSAVEDKVAGEKALGFAASLAAENVAMSPRLVRQVHAEAVTANQEGRSLDLAALGGEEGIEWAAKCVAKLDEIDQGIAAKLKAPENADRGQFWQLAEGEDGDSLTIYLYDPIGRYEEWGDKSAAALAGEITSFKGGEIHLHIDSPGGDMFQGIAMYNLLRRHDAKVVAYIDGQAASAASVVAMAADEIVISENAYFWLHNPQGGAWGYAEDVQKVAEALLEFRATMQQLYSNRTGLSVERVTALMDGESWINAQDAVDMGFADMVEPGLRIAARFNLSGCGEFPERFHNEQGQLVSRPAPVKAERNLPDPLETEAEKNRARIEAACAEVGRDDLASVYVTLELTPKQAKDRLNSIDAIQDLCVAANREALADEMISEGLTLAESKSRLFDLVKSGDVVINSQIPADPAPKQRSTKVTPINDVYKRRRENAKKRRSH